MSTSQVEQKVLIIGAGIVGLLIAQGLKKEGIPCTVFESESASQYRPREWGMSIQLPSLKTLLPLLLIVCVVLVGPAVTQGMLRRGKVFQIPTTAVDPHYEPADPGILPTFNGATGELLKNIPLLRMYRVSRRKFRAFCAEDIDIQYGKKLSNIIFSDDAQTVTTHFEDGTDATGTLVVGADGTHSQVRHVVFDGDKNKAAAKTVPYNAINLHVSYNDADKARHVRQRHPIMYHAIHPKGYWLFVAVQDVPDPEKPETWVFQLQTTWKKITEPDLTEEEVSSLGKHWERAQEWGEPFKSANLWIPEGTKLNVNKMAYWIPEKWNTRSGRVILAGDAAHPMTFQRGQGLNHGIADAAYLTNLMRDVETGGKTLNTAMTEYMEEMVERAGEETKMSLVNTDMLHDFSRMMNSPLFQKGGHATETNKQALEEQRHKEQKVAEKVQA